MSDNSKAKSRRKAALNTPSPLGEKATRDISAELNALLADILALYMKTKNFHWHMSGPYFRDYHLLLDEQSDQIYATIDPIAERVRAEEISEDDIPIRLAIDNDTRANMLSGEIYAKLHAEEAPP